MLSADQIYEIETHVLPDLYTRLRPNLVALVDAFDFHDYELGKFDIWFHAQLNDYFDSIDSCLGRYDGQVYEALMERARLNPTNRHKVNEKKFLEKKNTFDVS